MVRILRIRNDEILNFLDSPILKQLVYLNFCQMMKLSIKFTVLEGEGSYIEILGSTEMASAFFLDFEKKPTVEGVGPYYICCSCETHIALFEERDGIFILDQPPTAFFKKVVNVIKDDPEHHRPSELPDSIAIVSCVKCNTWLGLESSSTSDPPSTLLYKYLLRLDRLILKKEGQLQNSVTGEPFTEEPHPNAEITTQRPSCKDT